VTTSDSHLGRCPPILDLTSMIIAPACRHVAF